VAYALVSNGTTAGTSDVNQWINLFGAMAAGYSAFSKRLWPVVALDLFWASVSIKALIQIF